MPYLFELLGLEADSPMTGVWAAQHTDVGDGQLLAYGHLLSLDADHDGAEQSELLAAHLTFHVGGFRGVGPDGRPWVYLAQVAPASEADWVESVDPYSPMVDAMDRALRYNLGAELISSGGWSHADLVDVYGARGIDPERVAGWTVRELMVGLVAECCDVSLAELVAAQERVRRLPDEERAQTPDVFADAVARWSRLAASPTERDATALDATADTEVVAAVSWALGDPEVEAPLVIDSGVDLEAADVVDVTPEPDLEEAAAAPDPMPVAPETASPELTSPEPIFSNPIAPAPISPEPVSPEPNTAEPTSPEPISSDVPVVIEAADVKLRSHWPKKEIKDLKAKKLRRMAIKGNWDDAEIDDLSRKGLIKLLATPKERKGKKRKDKKGSRE